MTGPYLTPGLRAALVECSRHSRRGLLYWFRPKSMAALSEMGLVEQWTPPGLVAKRPRLQQRPWRVTAAGRFALA